MRKIVRLHCDICMRGIYFNFFQFDQEMLPLTDENILKFIEMYESFRDSEIDQRKRLINAEQCLCAIKQEIQQNNDKTEKESIESLKEFFKKEPYSGLIH